jgi:diguanylate cyclase (GGDEF)-like protein
MLPPIRIKPDLSPLSAVAIALLTLVVVGILDYLTGFEISFSVFYLVPVSLVAWYAGKNWGIFLTVLSSITWYAVEAMVGPAHDHPAIPAWNGVVRFVFFLVTSLLLSTLRERLAEESRMARTDGLTGLLNSRAFAEQLAHDLALNARSRGALTVVYIDLDNFKTINDRGGHTEGDRQLQRVADRIRDTMRHADSAGRLGGDEFALILPATDREGAEVFLARLARMLEAADTPGGGVRCSIGALTVTRGEPSADAVIGRADSLMYTAKQAGKNRFVARDYADT